MLHLCIYPNDFFWLKFSVKFCQNQCVISAQSQTYSLVSKTVEAHSTSIQAFLQNPKHWTCPQDSSLSNLGQFSLTQAIALGLSCATTHIAWRPRHTDSPALSCDMPRMIKTWYKLTALLFISAWKGEVKKASWPLFLAHPCSWPSTDIWCQQRTQIFRQAPTGWIPCAQTRQLPLLFLSCMSLAMMRLRQLLVACYKLI